MKEEEDKSAEIMQNVMSNRFNPPTFRAFGTLRKIAANEAPKPSSCQSSTEGISVKNHGYGETDLWESSNFQNGSQK